MYDILKNIKYRNIDITLKKSEQNLLQPNNY